MIRHLLGIFIALFILTPAAFAGQIHDYKPGLIKEALAEQGENTSAE